MRKVLCFILAAALAATIAGCVREDASQEDSIRFYYLQQALDYGSAESVIAAQETAAPTTESALLPLLEMYLKGPEEETLASPFPAGTRVLEIRQENDELFVLLSRDLAQLTGLALTKACACLALTCFELTDARSITVQAAGAMLDNAHTICLTRDSLVLQDTAAAKK